MKLKFRSKCNHDFTNPGYLHSAVWKALYYFKIKKAQEARHSQFFFQNIQNREIFKTFEMLKTTVELTLTTQKANACSLWTACSDFNWKYLFWVNLVQNLKIISLSWNFVHRLTQTCRIPWWYSLFLFSTENTFWSNFGLKKSKLLVWAGILH